jgi:cytochrome P450
MPLHDSVLRETFRLNPSFDDSMLREVVAPAGIYTPEGVYLPCGSHVAMHTRLMQRSEWSGEDQDWTEFRPFRYCEMAAGAKREVGELCEGDDVVGEERGVVDVGQVSAVQISGRYLLFGLGRHAW